MEYTELREQMKSAMKTQDKVRLSIIRQVLGDVDAYAKDSGTTDVPSSAVDTSIKKVLRQTNETLEASRKAANDDNRTATLAVQAAILSEMLPPQLEGQALNNKVVEIVSGVGATSMRDMGRVMSALSEASGGNFDKAAAAAYAKELLGK